jgi:metal-responsive CopG/Arc/MetJ family transcriptional regulator
MDTIHRRAQYRRILIALPHGMLKRLDEYADRREVSRAAVVRHALEDWLTTAEFSPSWRPKRDERPAAG